MDTSSRRWVVTLSYVELGGDTTRLRRRVKDVIGVVGLMGQDDGLRNTPFQRLPLRAGQA